MKALKVTVWIVLLLAVVIGGAVYYAANNINGLVKQLIEEVGSETLTTQVSVESVDIKLSEARALLGGLSIANPPGFDKPHILVLNRVEVDLDLEAMLEKRIDMTLITVDGMQVIAEQKGVSTNVQSLLNRMPSNQSSKPDEPPAESGPSPLDDLLLKVSTFKFVNSDATVLTEKWGEQRLDIPAITLNNLGGERGVPPDQFATVVFNRLLKDINKAVQRAMEDALKDKAKEKLKEKEDELKEKYRDKLKDKFGDDADDVESSLKSLFK